MSAETFQNREPIPFDIGSVTAEKRDTPDTFRVLSSKVCRRMSRLSCSDVLFTPFQKRRAHSQQLAKIEPPFSCGRHAPCALMECRLLPIAYEHCLFCLIRVENPRNPVVVDEQTGTTSVVWLFEAHAVTEQFQQVGWLELDRQTYDESMQKTAGTRCQSQ